VDCWLFKTRGADRRKNACSLAGRWDECVIKKSGLIPTQWRHPHVTMAPFWFRNKSRQFTDVLPHLIFASLTEHYEKKLLFFWHILLTNKKKLVIYRAKRKKNLETHKKELNGCRRYYKRFGNFILFFFRWSFSLLVPVICTWGHHMGPFVCWAILKRLQTILLQYYFFLFFCCFSLYTIERFANL